MAERWRVGLVAGVVLAATACSVAPRPFVTPVRSGVVATEDLVYGEATDVDGDRVSLRLDVIEPAGDSSPSRPAVVVVHGGGFTTGNRGEIRYLAEDLARRGFVAVPIDYRLRSGNIYSFADPSADAVAAITDARHDAQAAVRWVKAHAADFRVDPSRVSITGYSAGGMTALGVAFRSDDPGTSGTPDQSSRVCTAVSLSGAAVEGGIDASDPSVTLLHGSADEIVPFRLAQLTALVAASSGRLHRFVTYPDVGHLVIIDPRARRYRDDIAEGLAAALDDGPCS